MTAQEKAKELVDKYSNYLKIADKYGYLISEDELYLAKQCALTAVEEALAQHIECYNKMKQLHPYMLDVLQSEKYKYWQEVKHKLNKSE